MQLLFTSSAWCSSLPRFFNWTWVSSRKRHAQSPFTIKDMSIGNCMAVDAALQHPPGGLTRLHRNLSTEKRSHRSRSHPRTSWCAARSSVTVCLCITMCVCVCRRLCFQNTCTGETAQAASKPALRLSSPLRNGFLHDKRTCGAKTRPTSV